MAIAYAAHTQSCTFFLDEDGVCRQIVRRATGMRGVVRSDEDAAGRCIGAQYVATIDIHAEGLLAAMPKVGAPLLFAYVTKLGKIALVRTGKLVKFEVKGAAASSSPPSSGSSPPPPTIPNPKVAGRDSGIRQLPREDRGARDDDDDNVETQRFVADTHMPASRRPTIPAPPPVPRGMSPVADRRSPIPEQKSPTPERRSPVPARESPVPERRSAVVARKTPIPARPSPVPERPERPERRAPVPTPVRHVTMVPPSNNSAPTLPKPREERPAQRPGMLPTRRRA